MTAPNITIELDAAKRQLDQLGFEIKAMARDNEAKMRRTGELFAKKHGVVHIGDCAHVINLIFTDLFDNQSDKTPEIQDCVDKANQVAARLRKSKDKQFVKDLAGITNRLGVKIGVLTRWSTYVATLKFMLKFKNILKTLAFGDSGFPTTMPADIVDILLDDKWWMLVEDLVDLLMPLDKALVQLEGGFVTLGEVYYRYFSVWKRYEENTDDFELFKDDKYNQREYPNLGDDLRVHMDYLFENKWQLIGHIEDENRANDVAAIGISNATHAAVYLIDPRYRNKLNVADGILVLGEILDGKEVLKQWAGDDWENDDDDEDDDMGEIKFGEIWNHYKNGTGVFALSQ